MDSAASTAETTHQPPPLPVGRCVAALVCLAAWLAVAVPPFLRMPLTNDTQLYDLQAAMLRDGGVLYRDVLEPNFPGIVWIHAGVRAAGGWSSESMRLFDLAVVAAIALTGVTCLRASGISKKGHVWFAVAALGFYLSMSEWCHCQRDTWMLLPTLGAISLRIHRCQNGTQATSMWRSGIMALVEGLLWGTAIWIKPHVLITTLGVWGVSQWIVRRFRWSIADGVGMLIGGALMGAAGSAWMLSHDCWPAFWATMSEWNPRYFQAGREHFTATRFVGMSVRMWPWSALHLVATFASLASLARLARTNQTPAMPLVSAAYLASLSVALLLQHLFDYVFVPTTLLAILVVVQRLENWSSRKAARFAAAGFALIAVCTSPCLKSERLSIWTQCVTGPNSPHLQDKLAHFENPRRVELERIGEFLKREGASDRDVCLYNSDFVALYNELGLTPPTRFVYLHELLVFFPDRRAEISREVATSGHQYVVTDLVSCGMSSEQALEIGPEGPLAPPPAYTKSELSGYPWSSPVVFRAGSYLVHKRSTAAAETEPDRTMANRE